MATYASEETVLDLLEGIADSDLNSHTPNTGGAWSSALGAPSLKLDGVGGVYNGSANPSVQIRALNATAFQHADQFGQCQIANLTDLGNTVRAGVAVRASVGVGTCAGYVLYYQPGAAGFKLSKFVANAETVLETYADPEDEIPFGEVGSALLLVRGDQLVAICNGHEKDPVTDAAIAGPGAPGVILYTQSAQAAGTGQHVRQLLYGAIP